MTSRTARPIWRREPHTPRRAATAPIDYADIRRVHQAVRIAIGVAVAALGALAIAWDAAGWHYLLVPALAVTGHAILRLVRPAADPLASMLIDVTLLGMLVAAVGDAPQAEIAAVAYVGAAALLMLSPRQATLVLGYAIAWAVAAAVLSPITGLRATSEAGGVSLDRLSGIALLALLGGLLLTASRVLHRLRRRQEQALEAERAANRLKDEFVSMVSHEFRTPLTSIAGFVEALRESWQSLPEGEVDEFLAIAHGQTLHLSHLVEDVLVIPRLEAGRLPFERKPFDLRTVVQQVVSLLMPSGGRETEVAIPGGVYVHADPQRVMQVLRNLIENAIKYGGDQILIEGEPAGAEYRIVVADNGPGVPQGSDYRIFEIFEQATKGDARTDRGMGLGLPIARRLTEAMGGRLWHERRFPTGSRFCLTLPAASPHDGPGRSQHSAQADPGSDGGPVPQPTGVPLGSM